MKKTVVTSFFIFVFVVYSLYQYFGTSQKIEYVASSAQTKPSQPTPVVKKTGLYTDGTYTGNVADAYYGNIQVQAIIQNGKITDVQFLQYPSDRNTSIRINNVAMPILKSEAITAQNANVDIVSGATDSSQAFQQSLGGALAQAKNS